MMSKYYMLIKGKAFFNLNILFLQVCQCDLKNCGFFAVKGRPVCSIHKNAAMVSWEKILVKSTVIKKIQMKIIITYLYIKIYLYAQCKLLLVSRAHFKRKKITLFCFSTFKFFVQFRKRSLNFILWKYYVNCKHL